MSNLLLAYSTNQDAIMDLCSGLNSGGLAMPNQVVLPAKLPERKRSIIDFNENISVLKCPGGTSGISQPNDLMKSHMIFRQATTLPNYWNKFATNEYALPEYWTDLLLPYFKASGVSAAPQDTYGFFFSTLSGLISKSFTVDIV